MLGSALQFSKQASDLTKPQKMDLKIYMTAGTVFSVLMTSCHGLCIPSCGDNQECVNSVCECLSGFYGASCTDICQASGAGSCQNGGTCGSTSPKTCTCLAGYTGSHCETESTTTVTTTTPLPTTTSTTSTTTTAQNNHSSASIAFSTLPVLFSLLYCIYMSCSSVILYE